MNPGARRFRVAGRVQGVGFRFATQRRAVELGLAGWVRNLADGSVEVQAEGESAALDELASWLQRGPSFARVDELTDEPCPRGDHAAFEIRR